MIKFIHAPKEWHVFISVDQAVAGLEIIVDGKIVPAINITEDEEEAKEDLTNLLNQIE